MKPSSETERETSQTSDKALHIPTPNKASNWCAKKGNCKISLPCKNAKVKSKVYHIDMREHQTSKQSDLVKILKVRALYYDPSRQKL